MGTGYWSQYRLSRRRVLIGAAVTGAASAGWLLTGCGDDRPSDVNGRPSGTNGSPTAVSGPLATPQDTTSEAKPGGVWQKLETGLLAGAAFNLDFLVAGRGGSDGYERLLRPKPGLGADPTGELEGELAEHWEISDDGMQITFRLRRDVKFDQRAPTNGRLLDAEDVVFSWNKFAGASPPSIHAASFVHSINPQAPIVSMSAPDASTVVVKLAFPSASILANLARPAFVVQPVEADGGYDARQDIRGTGPWRLTRYESSVMVAWERNPDYRVAGRPLFDGMDSYIIPEYATQHAQFRAGRIWSGGVSQQDIVRTKRDLPQLDLYVGDYSSAYNHIWYGYGPDSPFRDERVRWAVAHMFDRATANEIYYSLDTFRQAGLPAEEAIQAMSISRAWGSYWIDPLDSSAKGMGEASKFFTFDPAEAKKLMSAAGFSDGFDTEFLSFPARPDLDSHKQLLAGMLKDGGIRTTFRVIDTNEYLNDYYFKPHPTFTGLGSHTGGVGSTAPETLLVFEHDDGNRSHRPKGIAPESLNQLVASLNSEFDVERQIEITHEVIRQSAALQATTPWFGTTPAFSLWWPWVRGVGERKFLPGANTTDDNVHLWYDPSRR